MNIAKKIFVLFFAVSVAIPQVLFAQVKQHDYTKTNKTLERSELEKKSSSLIEQRASMGKSVEIKTYKNTKDASALMEKTFFYSDKQSKLISSNSSFRDSTKKFDASKTFKPEKESWRNSEKQQKLLNTEKDLSKKYRGKIDIDKRSILHKDYLENVYENMQERSMQDINKYQFRRSHPTDPGIKITRAGSEAEDKKQSSFLDMFSARKNIRIETPLATFKGIDKQANKAREDPSADKADAKPVIKNLSKPQNSKVKSVQYLDSEKSSKYQFLRVPEGMKAKGKAVIKVETDD